MGPPAAATIGAGRCAGCRRAVATRPAFTPGGGRRCLRCALRYRPMPGRSAPTALVVGALPVAINHGPTLAGGDFPMQLGWQIPLTYAVPFCVATWGAPRDSRSGQG